MIQIFNILTRESDVSFAANLFFSFFCDLAFYRVVVVSDLLAV